MQSTTTKRIIVTVVIIAVLGSAVYYFFFRTTTPTVTLDQFGNPVAAQVVGQDLLDLLAQLQTVTLDQSIFSSPAFLYLTDFGVTLAEQPQGRTNPFAPINGAALPTATGALRATP